MGRGLGKVPVTPVKPIDIKNAIGEATISPLIERGWVVASSPTGTRAQFVWHVKDIGGPVEMALANATQVVGIPLYGEMHPILRVPVSNVRADPVEGSPEQAYVTVEYGLQVEGGGGWFDNEPSETDPAQIELVSTVQGTTTNMHLAGPKKGQQILVYQDEEVPEGEEGPPFRRPQGGEVAVELPMNMVIFRRRESVSPGIDIQGGRRRSMMYVGHTNGVGTGNPNGTFLGDVPGVWLCTKMDGPSDDNGVTWNVTYEFQRREGRTLHATTKPSVAFPNGQPWELEVPGWDALAVYRDPDTGEAIEVTERHEVEVVQFAPRVNFHELRLYVP